jgi:hypothetical protein
MVSDESASGDEHIASNVYPFCTTNQARKVGSTANFDSRVLAFKRDRASKMCVIAKNQDAPLSPSNP